MQNCGMPPICNLGRKFEYRNGGQRPFFWPKTGPNLSEHLFLGLHLFFGPKTGLNLTEERPFFFFFFGLHLSLGRKTDLVFGWKIFILVFINFKFSAPPFRKSCVRYWSGPSAQMVGLFLVFTYIWQEDVAKILEVPGTQRNVNPAQE